ncbi:uncharacterized protein LOC129911869 [Episyrphus balteatus]|uniref:uncharacterized protein LOC129911869 n=1 Tax=Episyrphus balteatus TaxID=286459 RepID=UPI0024858767|nr:uncharacterized protein LOC129911869 [Episyrphus balteatus]
MASVTILFFVSVCLVISGLIDFAESFPLEGASKKVVYTRYVRRRPIPYSNDFVEEVIEVFNTQRRPPPYAFLHDEDLTRFVRCDFDPSMPDCDDESQESDSEGRTENSPLSTTTTKPSSTSTTSSSSFWWQTKTETTSTTTEQNSNSNEEGIELRYDIITEIPETTSTTRIPAVSIPTTSIPAASEEEEYGEEDENNEGDNGNDYEGETNQDTKSNETDDPGKTEYNEEDENAENNNNSEVVAEVEIEKNGNDDDEGGDVTEDQTQEATTKKSFFNWF